MNNHVTEFIQDNEKTAQGENQRLMEVLAGRLVAKSIVSITRDNDGPERGWVIVYRRP